MKRLFICLVALVAVFAMVMPISAAEMKVNGIWNAKAWHRDNYDGYDDADDSVSYVTQRMRMYFNFIASENLKLVYKNEMDIEWGDSAGGSASRNDGGGVGADAVQLETKNVYLEFMVPDTPLKATMGLQGITLHKGWFVSDDFSAARFDMNFDPVSITAYWAGLGGLFSNDTTGTCRVQPTAAMRSRSRPPRDGRPGSWSDWLASRHADLWRGRTAIRSVSRTDRTAST